MKGKFHTEEAVKPILQRKGIIINEFGYDEHNNQIIVKEIGIPLNVQPGLRLLGKLDFMRGKGWIVLKMSDMTENTPKSQKRTVREPFVKEKRKKIIITKMKN